jgi:hypothetical protein
MVRASEIRDEATLRAWLEGRPQKDAVAIANRAALRVFPLWAAEMGRDWVSDRSLTALSVLQVPLTLGVYLENPTKEVRAAAAAGARAAALAAPRPTSAPRAAAWAARAAALAARSVASSATRAALTAARAASGAASAATFAGPAAATATAKWRAVSADAEGLEAGADVRSAPLWSEDPPQSIAIATRIFLNLWSGSSETWDFWRRWWEGVQDGRPPPSRSPPPNRTH